WIVASRMNTILPFLWTRVTDVSLRIPWQHKRTRRLVATLVEELDPWLSTVPTDRGAPFQPLRFGTAVAYSRYLFSYTSDIIKRHYFRRTPAPLQIQGSQRPPNHRRQLSELAECLQTSRTPLHEEYGLIDEVKSPGGHQLNRSRKLEFLTVLQMELLWRRYPG